MFLTSRTADRSHPSLHRIRVIGHGSYAVVYLAQIDGSDEKFAVKSVGIDVASSLMKEKRIYEAFQGQPEILHCYTHLTPIELNGSVLSLVFEYASAGTLRDLTRGRSIDGVPEKDVRSYVRTILTGLSCLHAKGYVHCDLKPGNILLFPSFNIKGPPYRVKLADFGLAKEPHEEIPTANFKGKFRGTPFYMSPESVKEGIISPAMDVWAVGCVVVQLIAGLESPWPSFELSRIDKFRRLLVESDLKPEIPDSMSESGKDFLRICFERDHTKRLSASELLRHPFLDDPPRRNLFAMCFYGH